ncbi:MAG: hypothetical protein KA810_15550, partial [Pyrinomonadaceae bacterium]|nr:hypothetical protein [Pyrinomonadaceae bacterium]
MDKLKFFFAFLLLFSNSIYGFAVQAALTRAVRETSTTPIRERPVNPYAIDVDLLIVGGTIVTMNAEREVIVNGAIGITNGKIDIMGTRNIVVKNTRPKRVINAAGKVIIPGL